MLVVLVLFAQRNNPNYPHPLLRNETALLLRSSTSQIQASQQCLPIESDKTIYTELHSELLGSEQPVE